MPAYLSLFNLLNPLIMKTDSYTRVVLTLIAACLLVLVLRPLVLVPAAVAAAPAGDRHYGLVPVNADGSVTVRLQTGSPMKVAVVSISSPSRHTDSDDLHWDTIPTSR